MANKETRKKELKTAAEIDNNISFELNRTNNILDKQEENLDAIISQVSTNTVKKYGSSVPEGKLISFFNDVSFKNITNQSNLVGGTKTNIRNSDFKQLLQDIANNSNINILLSNQSRINNFENYETIDELIPECHLACETYVSNILSPDDFTKEIFNYSYDLESATEEEKTFVKTTIDKIIDQYDLNNLTQKIVAKTVTLGEYYVAVLPYDEEFARMINNGATKDIISESTQFSKADAIKIEPDNINLLTEEYSNSDLLKKYLEINNTDNTNILYEEKQRIADYVNNNIKIGSSKDILKESADAYSDFHQYIKHDVDIDPEVYDKKTKSKSKNIFEKPENFLVNGSVIRELEPKRVIPLEIDNVCYGYYYVEAIDNEQYNGSLVNLFANSANTLNGAGGYSTVRNDTTNNNNPTLPAAQALGTTDEMFMFITNIFLKAIATKLDKKIINDNKDFKDLIYQLVKLDYIRKKQIKITYFTPEEVVRFKDESIHKNIVFFAKLYIATLTNDIIIKLSKAHDHRIYYVKIGADKNTSQAIQSTIRDIKTKQYTYGNLSTFSTILSNSPGIGDDIFIPVGPNGERAVDIDVLQGMQDNINNEFLEFLKNAIINGEGLPTALVSDLQQNIEFARNVSQQNLNFARKIVRRQSNLEPSFSKFIRLLFQNEIKNSADVHSTKDKNGKDKSDILQNKIVVKYIKVTFPSPMSLNMTNMLEQSGNVSQLADFIVDTIAPALQDNSNSDERLRLRGMVVQNLMPSIDWKQYKEYYENQTKIDDIKHKLKTDRKNKVVQNKNPQDAGNGFDGSY